MAIPADKLLVKISPRRRGCSLFNAHYAKVFYCFKKLSLEKESNFSVKSGALRREQTLLYTE